MLNVSSLLTDYAFPFLSAPNDLAQPLSFNCWNVVNSPLFILWPLLLPPPARRSILWLNGLSKMEFEYHGPLQSPSMAPHCLQNTGQSPKYGPQGPTPAPCPIHPLPLPLSCYPSIPSDLQFPDNPCSPASLYYGTYNFLCLQCSPALYPKPWIPRTLKLMGTYSEQLSLDSSFPRLVWVLLRGAS